MLTAAMALDAIRFNTSIAISTPVMTLRVRDHPC